jgi:hypothetical protein
MMMSSVRSFLTLFIAIAASAALHAQKNISVASPNGVIKRNIQNTEDGILYYSFTYKNKRIIEPSKLGFSFSKPALQLTTFRIAGFDTTLHDEIWNPV